MAKLPTEFSIDYLAKVYRSIFTFHCLIIDNAIIFDNKKGELRTNLTKAKSHRSKKKAALMSLLQEIQMMIALKNLGKISQRMDWTAKKTEFSSICRKNKGEI